MIYELSIVRNEWRSLDVEASSEEEARNKVWAMIDCGLLQTLTPDHYETGICVEGVQYD